MGKTNSSAAKNTAGKRDCGRPKKKIPEMEQGNFDKESRYASSDEEDETQVQQIVSTPMASLSKMLETQPMQVNPSPPPGNPAKWGDRIITELFRNPGESKMRANQHPSFTLTFDSTVMEADEITISDEEIEEGLG